MDKSALILLKNFVRKKSIKVSIFLRGWEKKIVSIFHLRSRAEVEVSWGLNGAGSEIWT